MKNNRFMLKNFLRSSLCMLFIMAVTISCNKEDEKEQVINGYELTKDETWKGTILLKGDIVIPAGMTLTISAGTKITCVTENLVFDEGLEDGSVDFWVKGNLFINGESNDIVEIKSSEVTPTDIDWGGIGLSTNSKLILRYCAICDAQWGVFIYSSSQIAHQFNNCLFYDCESGIVDFGDKNLSIKNCTFNKVWWGFDSWLSNKSHIIENSEFNTIKLVAVDVTGLTDISENTIIDVTKSNFIDADTWKTVHWSGDGAVKNAKVTLTGCYGNITYPESVYGNTIVIKNPVTSPVSGAGCGFTVPTTKSSHIPGAVSDAESLKEHEKAILEARNRMLSHH
jgi:hypothetical protein